MRLSARNFFLLPIVMGLFACGGGGGDAGSAATPPVVSPVTPTPAGMWVGTTSTNRSITALVFADSTYFMTYSGVGSPSSVAGMLQGAGTATASAFSSVNAKDYNFEGLGVQLPIVSATFATKQTLAGSFVYPSSGNVTFTSTYSTAFDTMPTLAAAAGIYTGQFVFASSSQVASIEVTAGRISAVDGGCTISGTIAPRNDGNAYDITLSFSASPCRFPSQSFSGVAYLNAATKKLVAILTNPIQTAGLVFVGSAATP